MSYKIAGCSVRLPSRRWQLLPSKKAPNTDMDEQWQYVGACFC